MITDIRKYHEIYEEFRKLKSEEIEKTIREAEEKEEREFWERVGKWKLSQEKLKHTIIAKRKLEFKVLEILRPGGKENYEEIIFNHPYDTDTCNCNIHAGFRRHE